MSAAGEAPEALDATLRRRFRTAETAVTTGGGDFVLLHPASAEELISEADFERDERLPYWADVWPSSTVLAGRVATLDGRGRHCLELGCGLGLVTAAAVRAGFTVTATDYYDDALRFAAVNAWRNAGTAPATRHVDWRALPADLGRHGLVLASDVLYERPYAALVADAIARTLAADGEAIVADPGRVAAGAFVDECRARGLVVAGPEEVPFAAGVVRQTIRLYSIRPPPSE